MATDFVYHTPEDSGASNVTDSIINESQQTLTHSRDQELARILHLVIRPVLIVFGTIGNGLSFYIMRQGSLKKMSTCSYLSILALADTSKFCKSLLLIQVWKMVYCEPQENRSANMLECRMCIVLLSQGLLGLCCSIKTRDRIKIITLTAVLFE